MECVSVGTAGQFASITRRNNSLTAAGRALVFGLAFAVSIGIAAGFTLICGAWPVLPFAGAEMVVLFLAFRHVGRHAADYERVTLEGDRLDVEVLDGGRVARHGFNRFWTQVVCTGDGSRLALRSHGRELEIGLHINEEQRLELARQLRRRLGANG
jgi:uncharacterized membrane protein